MKLVRYPEGREDPKLRAILGRGLEVPLEVEEAVREVGRMVMEYGDRALVSLTEKYDGVRLSPEDIRMPEEELRKAWEDADGELKEALKDAAENIRRFHEHQKGTSWFVPDGDGVVLGKKVVPIRRVGVYVPKGLASSLLMAAVPAQVAGVDQICVCTPPGSEVVYAAAYMLGLDEVYRAGGAQAVFAMAYGTESIPKVDKIVGPGNIYVTEAKRQVYGTVGVDLPAGPSELVVVGDGTVPAGWAAADIISQAEHGSGYEVAACLTPSEDWAKEVVRKVERGMEVLPTAERARSALERHGLVVVTRTLEEALDLAEEIAPEHLELLVEDPWRWLDRLRSVGAIFLGPYSPEPVGDYFCGTNHILPTGGAARFASALGVGDFLREVSLVAYSEERLRKVRDKIARLAEAEGMEAHKRAVLARDERAGLHKGFRPGHQGLYVGEARLRGQAEPEREPLRPSRGA